MKCAASPSAAAPRSETGYAALLLAAPLFACCSMRPLAAQAVTAPWPHPVHDRPRAVVAGDFDGDG